MKRIYKIFVISVMMFVMMLCICSCSTADTVNYNLNKEADEFNDMIMLQAEGYMALSNNSANELVVTFKTGENQYYKDYIYLNDWTCYVMEQVEPKSTDRYHYELVFYPDRLIPDIEIK